MKRLNIAVIGAAGWIGGVHSECYNRLITSLSGVNVNLHTAVDIFEEPLKKAATRYGYDNWTTDFNDVINNEEIDVIDICCNNDFHKEITIKAAKKGKHVLCEKPLALKSEDAEEMYDVVKKYKVKHMINLVYRKYPSIAFIKEMVDSGDLGEITQFRCIFEQDCYADLNRQYNWHFKKEKAGGGALLTIAPHMIDLGRFLVSDFDEVTALSETFIKEMILPGKEHKTDIVDVDDATSFLVKFKNNAIGVFQTSWVTRGRKHHLEFELVGTKGTVLFNSERLNEIELAEIEEDKRKEGFKTIFIGTEHPYGDIYNLKTGMGVGAKQAFTIQLGDFIDSIINDKEASPGFSEGVNVVRYTEALQESADNHRWVKV